MFNQECEERRRDFMRALNAENVLKNAETKAERKATSKAYKKTINKQFVEYKKTIVKKIRNLKSKDPKGYWAILTGNNNQKGKQMGKIQMGKIHMDLFVDTFKSLNSEVNEHDEEEGLNLENMNTTDNISLKKLFTVDEIKENVQKFKKQ